MAGLRQGGGNRHHGRRFITLQEAAAGSAGYDDVLVIFSGTDKLYHKKLCWG